MTIPGILKTMFENRVYMYEFEFYEKLQFEILNVNLIFKPDTARYVAADRA
jgi:hypothetical protein